MMPPNIQPYQARWVEQRRYEKTMEKPGLNWTKHGKNRWTPWKTTQNKEWNVGLNIFLLYHRTTELISHFSVSFSGVCHTHILYVFWRWFHIKMTNSDIIWSNEIVNWIEHFVIYLNECEYCNSSTERNKNTRTGLNIYISIYTHYCKFCIYCQRVDGIYDLGEWGKRCCSYTHSITIKTRMSTANGVQSCRRLISFVASIRLEASIGVLNPGLVKNLHDELRIFSKI